MIIKKLDIPIYHGYLVIVFTNNLNKANKKLNLDLEQQDRGAFVQGKRDKKGISHYYAVFDKHYLTNCIIAHEITHIANWLFMDRNIKIDLLNDEPYAYLVGWITREAYKVIYKNRIKIYN